MKLWHMLIITAMFIATSATVQPGHMVFEAVIPHFLISIVCGLAAISTRECMRRFSTKYP
jgi:hypothetical protein